MSLHGILLCVQAVVHAIPDLRWQIVISSGLSRRGAVIEVVAEVPGHMNHYLNQTKTLTNASAREE